MPTKHRQASEQQSKENQEKLEHELHSTKRRQGVGDYTEKCPVCNADKLIMVINEKKGIASCSACRMSAKVEF